MKGQRLKFIVGYKNWQKRLSPVLVTDTSYRFYLFILVSIFSFTSNVPQSLRDDKSK